MGSAPEPSSLPAAPAFKNSYVYDENGQLSGSTSLDAQGNIVYRPRQLNAAEQINQKGIESTKQSLLQRLYSTPEEYTKAAQTEADAYAANASKVSGDQFTKDVNRIGEVSNTRGLMGSKAYADIMGQREKTQAETNATIGNNATAMRESLIQTKKGTDYNLYNLYNQAGNDYSNKAMQGLNASAQLGSQLNSFNQNSYSQQVTALNNQYSQQMQSYNASEPWRNYILPAAGAAAMFSDRRLKKNITPLFKVGDIQWYSFEYDLTKWPEGNLPPQEGTHVGVMADEVKHIPNAVSEGAFEGFDMVDYGVVRKFLHMENA